MILYLYQAKQYILFNMSYKYNYKSYTTKPVVNISYPIISIKSIEESIIKETQKSLKNNLSIEEIANLFILNNEQKRGYKYTSIERRKIKKNLIKDIKKGKYKKEIEKLIN